MEKYEPYFEVDKEGLAQILERKGKAFAVTELIQNAWDEEVSEVRVSLGADEKRGYFFLEVSDDNPEGFKDLSHAYTLFAKSLKKDDPDKRGRFNIGEKLVLAICREGSVASTKGTIIFDKKGRLFKKDEKTGIGSKFTGQIRMTQLEYRETQTVIRSLIPPQGVRTFFNGVELASRDKLHSFRATLPTERADEDGFLRPTVRMTTVNIYEPLEGEIPSLYEMGIPVVETGDRWHIDIQQKVPLSVERDNVTPAYLRKVRAFILNEMTDRLSIEDATASWVSSSLVNAKPYALEDILDKRFGKKRVIFDPSDMEGTKMAVSEGYAVIPPRTFDKATWANIRETGAALPAGQVTPSPKPFDPEGNKLKILPHEKWTEGIERTVEYCEALALKLLNRNIHVEIASDAHWGCAAAYGPDGLLYLNLKKLGHAWFDGDTWTQHEILIHEFAHGKVSDHLSREFYTECCRLGAKLAKAVHDDPEFFKPRRVRVDHMDTRLEDLIK